MKENTSKEFRQLVFTPFLRDKTLIFFIVLSLIVLSVTQVLLIALMGPFVKVPLSMDASQGSLSLGALLPPGLTRFFNIDVNWQVSFAALTIAIPLLLVGAQILKALSSFAFDYYRRKLTIHIAHHMRSEIFAALIKSPYPKIMSRSPAQWMSVIMNDIFFIEMRFSDILSSFVKDGALILSSFFALMMIQLETAIAMLFIMPFVVFGLGKLRKIIVGLALDCQEKYGLMTRSVFDLRQRFNFIRSQQGEATSLQQFRKVDSSYYHSVRKAMAAQSILSPTLEFLGFGLFAVVMYAFAQGAYGARLDSASVVQFFAALLLVFRPLKNLGLQLAQYGETRGSMEDALLLYRSFQNLSDPSEASPSHLDQEGPIKIAVGKTFYPDRDITVEFRDLELQAGKAIAVVGPSGGGKSSLIKTLSGLLEPSEWQANQSIKDVSAKTSMVSQFPFLFNDTVRSNLSYGATDMKQEDLPAALETVGLLATKGHDIHLDDELGPGLRNVSGGQRQLLTIARGILRDKSIWLFDEPTSAVDPQMEGVLMTNLFRQCREQSKCMIMVTHRLSYLESFDEVWFFKDGELHSQGTHQNLMEKNVEYRKFCQTRTTN